jgi:hypothetical protein
VGGLVRERHQPGEFATHISLIYLSVIYLFTFQKGPIFLTQFFLYQIRQVEVDTLRRSAYLRATTLFSWMITPTFVALFTFLTFTLAGNEVGSSRCA